MKPRSALLSALVLAVGALAARAALQEGMPPPATASPEHGILAHFAGAFETVTTMGEASERGMEMGQLMRNGLWVVSDFHSKMDGKPFAGHGVLGWDADEKKYVSTWVDSSSTHLYVLEGTWNEAKKTLTMESTEPDPMTGAKMVNVTRITDDDHHVFEMHSGGVDGPPMLTIQYTRKK